MSIVALAGCGDSGTLRSSSAPAVVVQSQVAEPVIEPASPPTVESAYAAMGDTVVYGGGGRPAASVTVFSVTNHAGGMGRFADAPKNGQYAVVDVMVLGEGPGNGFLYSPYYIQYQTPDGMTYTIRDGNAHNSGYEPRLGQGYLTAGQRTRGTVSLDVPVGEHGVIQIVEVEGMVVGRWKF